MIKPYYEHEGIVIYNADCRDVLPQLDKADLLLTDPPYGTAHTNKGGGGGPTRNDRSERNSWDAQTPSSETLNACLCSAVESVIWGGNYFPLPSSRGWLVWNKPERNFSMSEAELEWTSRDMVIRVFDHMRSDIGRKHPTQKPLKLMKWCLGFFPKAKTILDPYMGSGTTLLAAKQLNKQCVGIELEEKYCEIAALRLSQSVANFDEEEEVSE